MSKFTICRTAAGYKFDLRADNGQVVATSEVYATLAACRRGVASVRRNAPIAGVEEGAALPHPKFQVYQDRAGEYRFRLKAANGRVIGASEGYVSKAGCLAGVERVKKAAQEAAVDEL